MIKIKLTPQESLRAVVEADKRTTEMLQGGRGFKNSAPKEGLRNRNVEGCMGELALAKHLMIPWVGCGVVGDSDVGKYEVRTASKPFYRLIMHPSDHDNKIYWLLCGNNGEYVIKGWILGKDGKQDKYWQDPKGGRPAFFVPISALHNPEELI